MNSPPRTSSARTWTASNDLDRSGPELNSLISVSQSALEEARRLDRELAETGRLTGPLHGVPIVVKDQIETAGLPTTFGSIASGDYQPTQDATAIARLRDAGAIILGKTTLPDFATSWFSTSSRSGVTKNPYDLARDPGGSSSGTAAAVAANLSLVGSRRRHRRLDPPARVVLRPRRAPRHAWPDQPRRHVLPGEAPGHLRADDPDCGGRRPAP